MSLKLSRSKIESAEEKERQSEHSRSKANILNNKEEFRDSMDNIMIESFQSPQFLQYKQANNQNEKSNDYIKQFENNFVVSST